MFQYPLCWIVCCSGDVHSSLTSSAGFSIHSAGSFVVPRQTRERRRGHILVSVSTLLDRLLFQRMQEACLSSWCVSVSTLLDRLLFQHELMECRDRG